MSQMFDYIKYDEESKMKQEEFKTMFLGIEALAERLPNSRAKSLLVTYLEIAYMWTGKAIRDEQVSRDQQQAQNVQERG